jgi:hypothetical protein
VDAASLVGADDFKPTIISGSRFGTPRSLVSSNLIDDKSIATTTTTKTTAAAAKTLYNVELVAPAASASSQCSTNKASTTTAAAQQSAFESASINRSICDYQFSDLITNSHLDSSQAISGDGQVVVIETTLEKCVIDDLLSLTAPILDSGAAVTTTAATITNNLDEYHHNYQHNHEQHKHGNDGADAVEIKDFINIIDNFVDEFDSAMLEAILNETDQQQQHDYLPQQHYTSTLVQL